MVSVIYIHESYALQIHYHAIKKMRVTGYGMRRAGLSVVIPESRDEMSEISFKYPHQR
ncbi:hypothetical protein VCHA37P191_90098 [Vibrio chagasii]|nr:hypothetical protein VCHA36P166_140099 [Vibrio chagasii]CAH7140212.1 hypothetical protein VCHA38O210_100067 [Vibrio chagasii]CAH7427568.1 hypothetical protein VCHA37P191_90098 [Vibrio chagasii]